MPRVSRLGAHNRTGRPAPRFATLHPRARADLITPPQGRPGRLAPPCLHARSLLPLSPTSNATRAHPCAAALGPRFFFCRRRCAPFETDRPAGQRSGRSHSAPRSPGGRLSLGRLEVQPHARRSRPVRSRPCFPSTSGPSSDPAHQANERSGLSRPSVGDAS